MKKNLSRVVAGLALVLGVLASSGFAQLPDGSLWNSVNNPGGSRAIPVVKYNQATGVLSVDTLGSNRASNSASNAGTIGGDDVGMITLLVTGPAATSVIAPFNLPFDPVMGLAWSSMFFAGKMQLIGNTIIGQYVTPGEYPVFQYPAGTDLTNHAVEMAINFGPGVPGNVLNGVVQTTIPEPATLGLIGSVLLGLFGFVRRR